MKASPRVTLYCELLGFYKNRTIGFIASYRNQKKVLATEGIAFTEDLDAPADILQCNAQGLRTLWLLRRARRRGVKTIVYGHATAEELPGSFRMLGLLVPLYRRYLTYLYNLADAVICVSEYNRRLLTTAYRVPLEKASVISNGVDVEKFRPDPERRRLFRERYGLTPQETVVMNVAMAIRKKGTATFIRLATKFPDVVFRWYGGVFSSVFAPLPQPESPNFQFTGYVDRIEDAYVAGDVFVFPSYEENQGMVVIEAMASGLPVIVRDIPVYEGWLQDGVNCLKAANDDEFAIQLQSLLSDPELRARIARAGREMVLETHSLAAVGKELRRVYTALLKS